MSPDADELGDIERGRLRSLVEVDMDAARAVHADDYQLITPRGLALTKAQYLDGVASGELNYRVFEPRSPRPRCGATTASRCCDMWRGSRSKTATTWRC